MKAATAELTPEQLHPRPTLELIQGEEMPQPHQWEGVVDVAGLESDAEIVNRAQQKIRSRMVGDVAVAGTTETLGKPIKNLHEALTWARQGDQEGQEMVEANVGTDLLERVFKAGNIVKIRLNTDQYGNIYQHGQRLDDVQRNAYQLASDDPIIKPRTIAEANNAERIKSLNQRGLLEDHVFVRFSLCAEGASDEKLDDLSFFSDTKSMSVQAIYTEEGEPVEEVAMIAGVKEKGGERHDRRMVETVGRILGKDYEDKSASEIINEGVLIPKKYLKNGLVDVVKLLDDVEGTFFGQDIPRQDYVKFAKFCEERAAGFKGDVKYIAAKLTNESSGFSKITQANERLGKLVEAQMVDRALKDKSIDPNVFGSKSASHIVRARELASSGNHHEARAHMQVARSTAKSGSCPAAMRSAEIEESVNDISGSSFKSSKESWSGGSTHKGKCEGCKKETTVGVKNWCKTCIKGHCG